MPRQSAPLSALLVVFSLVSAACQRGSPSPPAPAGTTTSSAPAVPPATSSVTNPAPPQAPPELEAPLHLPTKASDTAKAPLLVLLHGYGSSPDEIRSGDWPAFAERNGIAWTAPAGPLDSKGLRFWNSGPSCCNFDGRAVDHVAALRELVERALASAPVDAARVFVAGFSNGGFMAHRLACDAPDLIRGIVSVAGAGPLESVTCRPASKLRVLQVHGDADDIVTYGGGHLFKNARFPLHASAAKTAADWAERLGCDKAPVAGAAVDLEAKLPGRETHVSRYTGCSRGQVELWTISSGSHYVASRAPALQAIWSFLNP